DSPGPGSVLRSAVIMSPAPGTEGPWSVRARSGLDTAAHLPADLGADGPSLCRAGAVGVPSRRRRTRDSKRGCHLRRPFEPPCAAIGHPGGRPVLDRAHACGARRPIRVLCPDKAWNAVTARCAWSPLKVSADPASREAKNSLERTRT